MRFHRKGPGFMREGKHVEGHQSMHNDALVPCGKCMTDEGIDRKAEKDAILDYILHSTNPYWSFRTRLDTEQVQFDALLKETKPWRIVYTSHRKKAQKAKQNAAAEILGETLLLPPNVTPIKSKKSS